MDMRRRGRDKARDKESDKGDMRGRGKDKERDKESDKKNMRGKETEIREDIRKVIQGT